MTNAGLRVFIQALYGLLIFGALLYGALDRNDSAAFIAAALGVLAVVLSQSALIAADDTEAYSAALAGAELAGSPQVVEMPIKPSELRLARVFWWASIILAGVSAVLLSRG